MSSVSPAEQACLVDGHLILIVVILCAEYGQRVVRIILQLKLTNAVIRYVLRLILSSTGPQALLLTKSRSNGYMTSVGTSLLISSFKLPNVASSG